MITEKDIHITPRRGHKESVTEMFDSIAPRYDFLNHFLSLGIDILWRKKAVSLLKSLKPESILDVATGTGDFAIEALRLAPRSVTGIDPSEGMLEIGRRKLHEKNLESRISLVLGDSENLPFAENEFDAVTVGFGVRNFSDLPKGLSEISRVLRKDGMAVILEFSRPSTFFVKQLYGFYFRYILPALGKIISGHSSAYTYLPESVMRFPEGKHFMKMMEENGFCKTKAYPLTFGIATIYAGIKC